MVKIIFNLYIKQRSADLFCRYFIFYHYTLKHKVKNIYC